MCPGGNKGDPHENVENSKILLSVLVANAIILVIIQTSVSFKLFGFFESMLEMMPEESSLGLKEQMRIASILQFPIALIYTFFPILTYLKLRRTYKTGKWSDMKAWFRLVGILSLISAFGIFFIFTILMSFFGGFMLLSFPFLATGIILLRSLKYIK